MNGLELSRAFYGQYGAPMLHEQFPEAEKLIAVGLIGSGSECLGFDDEVSQDHDFEPGFCLLLPDESTVDRRTAFLLERAYAKLPKEFMGLRRSAIAAAPSPPWAGPGTGFCGRRTSSRRRWAPPTACSP